MQPLADRVLVRPDPVVTETQSGIALVEDWPQETSGVVVSVGRQHPRKDEAIALADAAERYAQMGETPQRKRVFLAAAQLLRELVNTSPHDIHVGDRVIFGQNAGQVMDINGERLFVMRERDLIAVVNA